MNEYKFVFSIRNIEYGVIKMQGETQDDALEKAHEHVSSTFINAFPDCDIPYSLEETDDEDDDDEEDDEY